MRRQKESLVRDQRDFTKAFSEKLKILPKATGLQTKHERILYLYLLEVSHFNQPTLCIRFLTAIIALVAIFLQIFSTCARACVLACSACVEQNGLRHHKTFDLIKSIPFHKRNCFFMVEKLCLMRKVDISVYGFVFLVLLSANQKYGDLIMHNLSACNT